MSVEQVTYNSPDGATIGKSASELVGFHGSACDQAATIADVSTQAQNSGFGFSTSAQFATAMGAINSILAALEEKGILASS